MLSKDDTFIALIAAGAARAEVEFSGGGDEGGVDEIILYDDTGSECGRLNEYYCYSPKVYNPHTLEYVDAPPPTTLQLLAATLTRPIGDRYANFNNEPFVRGTVVWDVATRTVTIEGTETVSVDEAFEVEWDNFPDDTEDA